MTDGIKIPMILDQDLLDTLPTPQPPAPGAPGVITRPYPEWQVVATPDWERGSAEDGRVRTIGTGTDRVHISHGVSALLRGGDLLRWWDISGGTLPWIPLEGEIVTPQGRRIPLTGDRDVGLRTGHHPYLRVPGTQRLSDSAFWDIVTQDCGIIDLRQPTRLSAQTPWGTAYEYIQGAWLYHGGRGVFGVGLTLQDAKDDERTQYDLGLKSRP